MPAALGRFPANLVASAASDVSEAARHPGAFRQEPRDPLAAARGSGLVVRDRPLLVLLSGGGDSVCLLDVAVRLGARVSALHVNYGLRADAAEDERFCRGLCARLGVPLVVERVTLPATGNLQAEARRVRYELAERYAEGDYAAAHTATDQAETVLFRLATQPGSRALAGMRPRRGRLVRPLLRVTRAEVRAYLRERGLAWREDPSNADRRFARNRVRHDVLSALRELNPEVERAIAESARQVAEERAFVEQAARDPALGLAEGTAVVRDQLERLAPALQRHVLALLARRAAGHEVPIDTAATAAILALARGPGSRELHLPGGVRAIAEYGTIRFARGAGAAPPPPLELPLPGAVQFGRFRVAARLARCEGPASVAEPALARDRLPATLTVRAWRPGDRIRPLGLGGTKTLQDVFTDAKVPRALRAELPVVEAAGEIAWVAGVCVSERFAARPGEPAVVLSARLARGDGDSAEG